MAETASKVPVKIQGKKQEVDPASAESGWHPIEALRKEVDHLFDDFDKNFWRTPLTHSLFAIEPFWRREFKLSAIPACDIVEHDKQYELTVEVPGMTEKNITVELSEGMLTISGEKKDEKEEVKKNFHLSERHYGTFQRSFRVPENVVTDKIEAAFKDGVLTVSLPKNGGATKNAKKIAIKTS